MKRTPFYQKHVELGAKLVDFAGYAMPLQYQSIVTEHLAVRQSAGLFDVSHMGEFMVSGPDCVKFVDFATVNDVRKMRVGQAQYSAMCFENGGLVDDLLIYRRADSIMLVVNASNIEKDWQHLLAIAKNFTVSLRNKSDSTALLALQGPNSRDILQKLTTVVLKTIPYYHFVEAEVNGTPMLIARTGYTGELGFELYHAPEYSRGLWDALMQTGAAFGLKPTGLGARDSLRLEMKYCLYGNDIDETTNPLEARLGWITQMDKPDFVGKSALVNQKSAGLKRALVAFKMLERAIPRHGYSIFLNAQPVGTVTSGGHSPILNRGIGMGYVNRPYFKTGTRIEIDIRGKRLPAVIIKPPFINK